MLASELINLLNKKVSELGDVEVRTVAGIIEGFGVIEEVLDRRDYRDETFFSGPVEKGNFIVLEIGRKQIVYGEDYTDDNDY